MTQDAIKAAVRQAEKAVSAKTCDEIMAAAREFYQAVSIRLREARELEKSRQ
jgi:hypothetical protein